MHQKHQKHQKHKDAGKKKHKNANKRTKIKNALKKHLRGKKSLIRLCAFLCARRKQNRKKENSLQCNVLNTNVPTTRLMY